MQLQNEIHRFTFAEYDVRGELVQLNDTYRDLCFGHDYPQPVVRLLGELLAITSLLTATLKFEGHINVQVQGNGPINFATVNGSHDQSLRGVARMRSELSGETLPEMVGEDALLIITLTPHKGERYQGMVKIEHDTLAHAVESYFAQSEQLPTRIWLHADPLNLKTGGLMLQAMPGTGKEDSGYEHTVALADTITADELHNLPVKDILHRLYHEDDIHLYPAQKVRFFCGCSRERTADALRSISREELRQILEEEGELTLTCDYCLTTYRYDAIDIESLDAHQQPEQPQ
ncbi:MAG: Hsp33 family molecular chaperone HslO [Idiomarina sp.]|nr:Hsp33 family molecular chaperone HslO [Idiomarina sp.]